MKRWILLLLPLTATNLLAQERMDTAQQSMILRYWKTGVRSAIRSETVYEQIDDSVTGKIRIKRDTIDFSREGDSLRYHSVHWEDKQKYNWLAFYNLLGQQLHFFGDGYACHFKYDSSGLLLWRKDDARYSSSYQSATLNDNGQVIETQRSSYSESRDAHYHVTTSTYHARQQYYYTNAGKLRYIVHYDENDPFPYDEPLPYDPYNDEANALNEYDPYSLVPEPKPFYREEYQYNDLGQLIERRERHAPNKAIKIKEQFFYDSTGRLKYRVDSTFYHKKKDMHTLKKEYTYDTANRLVRLITNTRFYESQQLSNEEETWQYNELGSLSDHRRSSPYLRIRTHYEYDDHNNVISEVTYRQDHLHSEIYTRYSYTD